MNVKLFSNQNREVETNELENKPIVSSLKRITYNKNKNNKKIDKFHSINIYNDDTI